jgi:hypothetical protein
MFEMSHLLLGEDRNYISKGGVDKLSISFYFLIKMFIPSISTSPVKILSTTIDMEKERGIVLDQVTRISEKLKSLFNENRGGYVHQIDFQKIAETFFQSRDDVWERVESLIFLKRVILGGDVKRITHFEFQDALEKLPKIALIAFDLTRVDKFGLYRKSTDHDVDVLARCATCQKCSLLFRRKTRRGCHEYLGCFGVIDSFSPT